MDAQTQNTSLQRLQNVERRVVRVLDIAGGVMEELTNTSGPRRDLVKTLCGEFMQSIKFALETFSLWHTTQDTVVSVRSPWIHTARSSPPSPPSETPIKKLCFSSLGLHLG
ncbi:hypothetical protein F2Q70_00024148 [Brassica cretica]|uniref:Mediator of RNA polymerase II transcription subunit 11 n=1 Tax=Brassica cretica TaxID=69181 RepID=A0A8S9GFX0_BRACR|nr:hypothetical protein F2Q70_00024148 [Brassica cretica]